MVRAKVLIVGGGVVGTSIAVHAARRSDPLSEPVMLIERAGLAAGSSGHSSAILSQFHVDRALAGVARDALRTYAGFHARTGYSLGFRRAGVLTLAGQGGAGPCERIEANALMMSKIGIEVEVVRAARIRRLAPGIEVADGALAAYEPGAGFVDPRRTVESFAALARYFGATTRCGVEVTGLAVEDGRVRGVETSDGAIEAQQVVLAAGPWTPRLLASFGVELPLRVLRSASCLFESTDPPVGAAPDASADLTHEGPEAELEARFCSSETEPPVAHPVILDLELGSYCRVHPEQARTRVGKTDHGDAQPVDDPDVGDELVDEAFSEWARECLVRRLPAYADRAETVRRSGLITVTPDARAAIGPLPDIEGLFLAAGFSGHGFELAPSVGLGLAQMLADEPVSAFDPSAFLPQRLRAGEVDWGGPLGP